MTDHIQVRGERGSGKTLVAEALAERLAAQNHTVVVVVEEPRTRHSVSYRRVAGAENYGRFVRGIERVDTVIWDGEPCPYPTINTITVERNRG